MSDHQKRSRFTRFAIGALGVVLATTLTGLVTAPAASADTRQVQWDLAGLGYLAFGDVDGADGPQTAGAVEAFQTDRCLSMVDGDAGPETNGELSAQVTRVQTAAGADQDGMYGPGTEAAVKTWQGSHGLTQNGQADAATMTAMGIDRIKQPCSRPSPDEMIAQILQIAKQEAANTAHNREIGGYNCNFYSTALGVGSSGCSNGWRSEAWCADFVKWDWKQAGANVSGINGLASSLKDYGVSHHTWHTSGPKPGDAVYFTYGHVGIVVSSTATNVTYISGNTYNPATGNDDGLLQKTISRSNTDIGGYSSPLPR
ncbi:peptidoglycan-binding protein [Amycolatopsis sp. NPDC049252]|uniref:NlpC/P60 family protein n=1 Tax=Amycolatopsis sp. NPDC049252 TaxID=3363933 RepID=UPI00371A060D